MLKSLLDLRF